MLLHSLDFTYIYFSLPNGTYSNANAPFFVNIAVVPYSEMQGRSPLQIKLRWRSMQREVKAKGLSGK
jgi:hypothetical protein